jgi:hypothetical protein
MESASVVNLIDEAGKIGLSQADMAAIGYGPLSASRTAAKAASLFCRSSTVRLVAEVHFKACYPATA